MKRILLPLVAIVALAAVACGSGDKKPAPTEPPPEPTATTAAAASSSPAASSSGEEAVGGIFNTIFSSGALTRGAGGGDAGEMPARDASLKDYLLTASDVPSGYTLMGDFSYRLPDGISKDGGMDMAASMFMSGDPAASDPTGSTVLMSMVIKPDDLTQLGEQFSAARNLSEQDLRDAIEQGAGGLGGLKITDVQLLDAGDLGEGGFGMSVTIDMSELLGAFAGVAGDSEGAPDVASLSTMTMRMYIFGKGDYAAGVIRMGFAASLPSDVDEKELAKVLEGRLP